MNTAIPSSAIARPQGGFLRLAAPGLALTLAALIPFLNKAFTIDDPWFLMEARQILRTPFHPLSYPICWQDNETCLVRAGDSFPGSLQALMGYLLVPSVVAGGAEWIAHAIQLLLACVAVVEMVRISLRLGFDRSQAATAGVFLAAIPPFLSMASTAMPDLASLALSLTGFEQLLAWKQERRWHQALLSALMLGLAPGARLHLFLLIPVGAIWLFDNLSPEKALQQFRRDASLWIPIYGSLCVLIVFAIFTHDFTPAPPGAVTGTVPISLRLVLQNLSAATRYLAFPIPLTAVWVARHWKRAPIALLGAPIAILASLQTVTHNTQPFAAAASIFGAAALMHLIYTFLRGRDRLGILLLLWILIVTPLTAYAHLPIKYLLPVMPAIILLLLREIAAFPENRRRPVALAIIVFCGGFSVLLLRADADFANEARTASAELIAPHVARGEKVWYSGQWGFYWYADRAGALLTIPGKSGPQTGDLLAIGRLEGGATALKRFPHRIQVDSRQYTAPYGRTMGGGAGLYSNGVGNTLWKWSPEFKDEYELWRITE